MRIICTADWHVHNFSDFSRIANVVWDEQSGRYVEVEDGADDSSVPMNTRLLAILNGVCDMRDYAMDNDIHHILFAGDMFHHRGTIDVTVFNTMYQVLGTFRDGLRLHAIPGNHDQTDSSIQPMSALESLGDVIEVWNEPGVTALDNEVRVAFVPYSKDKEHTCDAIDECLEQCRGDVPSILVAHLGVDGATVGSGMRSVHEEYTLSNLRYDRWKYVVLGHYHQPQILADNTFYCGTPVQNNFNDELPDHSYNGFYVVDTDRRYDVQFVPVKAPRFLTLDSVDELRAMSDDEIQSNHIRIRSDASEVAEIQSELESRDVQGTDVRMELNKEYASEHRSDVSVTQSIEETVATYAAENWEDDSTLQDVISVGMGILSKAQEGR